MSQYITNLQVSTNTDEEYDLDKQGFTKISENLNRGIYLWYKTDGNDYITRIQFSFNEDMMTVLNSANYHQIPKNLNPGGNPVYLWFLRGSTEYDVPIVDLAVSTKDEAQKFKDGRERHACDLNREVGGHWVYLWVKREKPMYVCDVTATFAFDKEGVDKFKNGYIRVDEDTNRGTRGPCVFIMYRKTTSPGKAIKDLKVSTTEKEYDVLKKAEYKKVDVDLNQETGGNLVFLWYKTDDTSNPIRDLTQIVTERAKDQYEAAHVEVIKKNLNSGVANAPELFLCFYC